MPTWRLGLVVAAFTVGYQPIPFLGGPGSGRNSVGSALVALFLFAPILVGLVNAVLITALVGIDRLFWTYEDVVEQDEAEDEEQDDDGRRLKVDSAHHRAMDRGDDGLRIWFDVAGDYDAGGGLTSLALISR